MPYTLNYIHCMACQSFGGGKPSCCSSNSRTPDPSGFMTRAKTLAGKNYHSYCYGPDHLKVGPLEIRPSKCPDFKGFRIWNGQILNSHCKLVKQGIVQRANTGRSECRTFKLRDRLNSEHLITMYSGGSKTELRKPNDIRKPNVLKIGF